MRFLLRRFLLVVAALLLSACGAGYAFKPGSVDCSDPVNYNTCFFNPAV